MFIQNHLHCGNLCGTKLVKFLSETWNRIANVYPQDFKSNVTGKSFSEAFILTSINPQYDNRLHIDLPVQHIKTTSSEHVVYINYSECKNKKQFVYPTCSELVVFMYM